MISKRKKGGWVKWVVIVVVLAVLAVLAWPTIQNLIAGNTNGSDTRNATSMNVNNMGNMGMTNQSVNPGSSNRSTASVTRGSLSVAVSGSGKVEPADSRTVYSKTNGRVDTVDVKVGDTVRAGDPLVRLASDDLETEIASMQRTLFDAQIELAAVRDSGSSTNIYAPSTGRIKMMKAETGDDVFMIMKQYGYLCIISRDGKMKVEFEPENIGDLKVGDKVAVWIKNANVEGTVDQMTGLSGSISVTVADDTYDVGEEVVVSTLLGDKLGTGKLEVNMPIPVTGIGGTVETIYYEDNDTVGSGSRLFYLTGRTPSSELQKAILAYSEARIALENAHKEQEGLTLRAPIDGVITAVNASEGAKMEEGFSAFSIQSSNDYKVVAAVDELDIVNVKAGQNVSVELDAYPNRTFNAVVSRISGVGTVEGGVATYEVTVTLEGNEGFMDGMTANVDIKTTDKSGVLLLPVEAISTSNGQNYVTLSTGMQTMVTTGDSDGTNIEILSGLNEGDQVMVTRTANSGSVGTFSGGANIQRSGGNMSVMPAGGGNMMMRSGF